MKYFVTMEMGESAEMELVVIQEGVDERGALL